MRRYRNSETSLNEIYFWTLTIKDWKYLLTEDNYKMIIIHSLYYLTQNELAKIYGYVIMPNHIHLIWQLLKMNGKESPKASFVKHTAHAFKSSLKTQGQSQYCCLQDFYIGTKEKQYEFWQRDPLAIPVYSRSVMLQKLDYMHKNPLVDKWHLSVTPEEYRYSSASYYATGIDEFDIVTHISELL